VASINTPFKEAIEFLRAKTRVPTKTYTTIFKQQNAHAFVSAGVAQMAILEDLHKAMIKASDGGLTRQQFRKEFDQILSGRGWPFNQADSPGYRDWRAGVIYDTNLRMAYQAGHWKQMQETADSRPFLEYSAILDSKTRPEHREWHGTILPIDHPWWRTHYPPNGWNCRCTVISRSAADLKRLGKKVSSPPPSPLVAHSVTFDGVKTQIDVPEGIDPGFDYNVGEAGFGSGMGDRLRLDGGADALAPLRRLGEKDPSPPTTEPLPRASKPKADLTPLDPSQDVTEQFKEKLKAVLNGDRRVFVDPLGFHNLVQAKDARHLTRKAGEPLADRFLTLNLLPEVLEDPHEIWFGFMTNQRTGQVLGRRRYLRVLEVQIRGKPVKLVAVVDASPRGDTLVTFFPATSDENVNRNVRVGVRLYSAQESKYQLDRSET
jgi:SPP1 gp7 family putative phage head morphogenesis protein